MQTTQPVSVSECYVDYVSGLIKYWTVRVEYNGCLALNYPGSGECHGLLYRGVLYPLPKSRLLGMYDYDDAVGISLNSGIALPEPNHMTGYFKYNPDKKTSVLEYSWRSGLVGTGAKSARKFREQMLKKINENQKG